ncbi:MAG: hypothetical protein AAF696_22965 [Bacteroidota bacterium]
MYRLFILIIFFAFSSCNLTRQVALKQDVRTDQLIQQGKRYLSSKKYKEAWDAFELARERDFNQASTSAIFLAGLSAYYLNYDDIALQRFDELIKDYPRSRYKENAEYHKAILLARSFNTSADRMRGLNLLARLSDSPDSKLAKDANFALDKELFENASLPFLKGFFRVADESIEQRVMEALLYKELMAGEREAAQKRYDLYLENKGKDSPFFQKLFPKVPENAPIQIFEPEILRVALFLPVYASSENVGFGGKIPDRSIRGLEFYEGIQIALDELAEESRKKIYLRVFDTFRDTMVTSKQLKELDRLQPQIIIGGIYNATSRIISRYAEQRGITQIVPMSPAADLVAEKSFTFLAHPSVKTHGARMADYAFNKLGLSYVSVFSDKSNGTADLADGFIERFSTLGGQVDTLYFGQDFKEEALEEIPNLIGRVQDSTGVYIPLMGNEEAASLIVNLLKKEEKSVKVMGSPHFRSRYTTLPIDVKEDFEILFSTTHLESIIDPNYKKVYNAYLKKFRMPPSDNSIQGYDLARFLINLMNTYDPTLGVGLETFVRVSPVVKGLHIDYYFGSTQSNQSVNIGQYTSEGVVRVN